MFLNDLNSDEIFSKFADLFTTAYANESETVNTSVKSFTGIIMREVADA